MSVIGAREGGQSCMFSLGGQSCIVFDILCQLCGYASQLCGYASQLCGYAMVMVDFSADVRY